MSTCCPNCPATAIGTETASLCTECATATVAGASFNLPLLIVTVACTAGVVFACQALRRRWRQPSSLATTPA